MRFSGPLLAVIVTAVALAAEASGAPPAGKLYYADKPFGNSTSYDIFSVAAAGGAPAKLTSSTRNEFGPAISPDGAKIAYTACQTACVPYVPDSGGPLVKTAIFVMNADGSGAKQLTAWKAGVGHASWSPDGSKLAYQAIGNPSGFHIWVIKADGTGAARVTGASQHFDQEPSWSPDGKRIAFIRGESIAALDLTAGTVTVIVPTTGDSAVSSPSWSPDGSQIAFSHGNGLHDIARVNADGTALTQVATGSGQRLYPAWSPDGSQIAFVLCNGKCRGATASINVVAATGGTPAAFLPASPDFRGWLAWH